MAHQAFKSILVGIEAPEESKQPALQRAAQLAQRAGARLELFHAAYSPFGMQRLTETAAVKKAIRQASAAKRARLESLAAPLRVRGLRVSTKIGWDYPAFEAIVRETLRARPDLVVAGSHRRAFGARLFLTNTDWELIRQCPAPLLFVKKERPYGKVRVLAAVDPLHASEPAQLDRRILEFAHALAAATEGKLDVAHAYMPPFAYAPVYGSTVPSMAIPELERDARVRAQRALARIGERFDVPEKQRHFMTGTPGAVLPRLVRKLQADVLVMGAVSRQGLDRLFIGSTAERILDSLPCDVLVVKPRGFRTRVPRRIAAP